MNAGDTINIRAPHYIFNYNTNIEIIGNFSGLVNTDSKSVIISPTVTQLNTTISFTILENNAITIPIKSCGVRTCPIYLSIFSVNCPITDYILFEREIGLLSNTIIGINVINNFPTYFPSSQPTGWPSSQPSSTPTSQFTFFPTSFPTSFHSSSPSFIPTIQPTRKPSNQTAY